MSLHPRDVVLAATVGLAIVAAGCANSPPAAAPALVPGTQATVEGAIASIDTKPWTYDGNAVVVLDAATLGRVPVQLPARWNLCKAPQVDVAALVVGQRARATGTVTDDRSVVVCERVEHRLGKVD